MNCRFCKLEDIGLLEDSNTYRCSYCGYSFEVSRAGILYDNMMKLPLASWLLASILWFCAILTGVIFGLGFNSASLTTTTLFLFIYGGAAFLFGFSVSIDYFQAIWIWIKYKFQRNPKSFHKIKEEVQIIRKKKLVSEMATGQAVDDATGMLVDTDIRPGERRIPKIAQSFLAGFYTLMLGVIFIIIFTLVFPPLT